MLRTIGAVVLGYVVMVVLVFCTFLIAYRVAGADAAFQPGSYEVTAGWITIGIVFGLLAAIVGGFACAAVSKGSHAPTWLAGLVLVLGLLSAIPAMVGSEERVPQAREGEASFSDAMKNGREPVWVAFVNPFIGVAGVLLGARLRGRKWVPEEEG